MCLVNHRYMRNLHIFFRCPSQVTGGDSAFHGMSSLLDPTIHFGIPMFCAHEGRRAQEFFPKHRYSFGDVRLEVLRWIALANRKAGKWYIMIFVLFVMSIIPKNITQSTYMTKGVKTIQIWLLHYSWSRCLIKLKDFHPAYFSKGHSFFVYIWKREPETLHIWVAATCHHIVVCYTSSYSSPPRFYTSIMMPSLLKISFEFKR